MATTADYSTTSPASYDVAGWLTCLDCDPGAPLTQTWEGYRDGERCEHCGSYCEDVKAQRYMAFHFGANRGLNAEWSVSAYHAGARKDGAELWVLDDETGGDQWTVVARKENREAGDYSYETIIEACSPKDAVILVGCFLGPRLRPGRCLGVI